ncbi:MAG: DMT family transporter [Rhodoglobus sp.]
MPNHLPELSDFASKLQGNAPIGIALAVIAAVLMAIATQLQHGGVAKVEQVSGHEGRKGLSLVQFFALLRRPSWVIGMLLMSLGVFLQLTSLTFAPITVVQPLGVIALIITAIVNSRVTRTPLDKISIGAIMMCVVGVGAFVAMAAAVTEKHPITATQLLIVLIILTVVLIVVMGMFLWMRRRTPKPFFYIIAAGVLFGFVVTLANVVIGRVQTILLREFQFTSDDILTALCLLGLVAAALLGNYFVQTAYSSNPPELVVAGLTVVDPIVAVAIGITVLGEAAGASIGTMVAFAVIGALAVWGVILLSRHHPQALGDVTATAVQPESPRVR